MNYLSTFVKARLSCKDVREGFQVCSSTKLTISRWSVDQKDFLIHQPLPAQALQATEGQTEELRGHVIIAGFGRVGQIIGQLLAERLIPFVAVDVRMDCVQARVSSHCCQDDVSNFSQVFCTQ